MKIRILAVVCVELILLGIHFLLSITDEPVEIKHVMVVNVGYTSVDEVIYTAVTYISNETNKEVKLRFASTEDYGFKDYFEVRDLYTNEEVYIDILLDEDKNILLLDISKEE